MNKKLFISILCIAVFAGCKKRQNNDKTASTEESQQPTVKIDSKQAEIVFCLDATGSMSGLITTAKEKIWDIVSELSQDQKIDTLKLGMVFYRDRGDNFITKQISLTTNLDAVYTDLLEIEAEGGGDSPESVNQALNEAVEQMKWSNDQNTYKTIFVVGDCPPHMDYQDDVLYTESCKIAAEKGIVINTIKLGNSCSDAITHFKQMSKCAHGKFLQLDQNATDYSIESPYDDEINSISKSIDESKLFYGEQKERDIKQNYNAEGMALYDKASKTSNSSRVKYKFSRIHKKSAHEDKEIVDDYKSDKISIDEILESELPEALKNKTNSEKRKILEQMSIKRDSSYTRLKELMKKRDDYIKLEQIKRKDTSSFSKEVVKIMREQSKKKN